jgi:hypothetical protein
MKRTSTALLLALLLTGCAVHTTARPQPEADDDTGATVASVWTVPGRALVCGGAAVLSAVTMTVTFGLEYETASQIMHGGCSGPWVASPQIVRAGGSVGPR